MAFSKEQNVLFQLLGSALFDRESQLPDGVDWDAVMGEAKQQAVLPLVFEAARKLAPDFQASAYAGQVDEFMVNNICREYEHTQLHQLMTEARIPYVIMKGSASAAYYPQPMLRVMGDVDFLVHPEDVKRGTAELKKIGFWERGLGDHASHQSFLRRDGGQLTEWELHWQPNGIPQNETGEILRRALADCVETSRLRETENGCYFVPDGFHHGLLILIHTARHLLRSGVGLRHLCDWAVFAAAFSAEQFCGMFREILQKTGLWDFAAALTAVSVRYLGCPDPAWEGELPEVLTEGLMRDILDGGNFGRKDLERLNEAKLIVDRGGAASRRGGGLRNLLSAIDDKTRRSIPAVNRYPVLLPAAWVYVGFQHLLRVSRGQRPKLRVKKMLKGAFRRADLYRQLRIFEGTEED